MTRNVRRDLDVSSGDAVASASQPVLAIHDWKSNAGLMADAASLGYIYGHVLDCTYGYGSFWVINRTHERIDSLTATDIDPEKSLTTGAAVDFTALPFAANSFDCVVFDPPYKLNGTPNEAVDERYGVATPARWQDRMQLILDGLGECGRVLGDGYLLVKCQDQVCSGKVRWQTYEVTKFAEWLGLGLVDRFEFLSYRPQPDGRRQVHARRNSSTLLVFKRGWK